MSNYPKLKSLDAVLAEIHEASLPPNGGELNPSDSYKSAYKRLVNRMDIIAALAREAQRVHETMKAAPAPDPDLFGAGNAAWGGPEDV